MSIFKQSFGVAIAAIGLLVSANSRAVEGCWQADAIVRISLDNGATAQESSLRIPESSLCFAADGAVYDGTGLTYRGNWKQAGNWLKVDFSPAYYEALLRPRVAARLGGNARVSIGAVSAYGKVGLNTINSELVLDNAEIFDGTGAALGKIAASGALRASLNAAEEDKAMANSDMGTLYAGRWESIRGGAGNVFSNSVFVSINIKSDGSFSGKYQKYAQTGNAGISNRLGFFSFSVWNPRGPAKQVKGKIDFDTLTATIFFKGLRKVTTSVEILSDNEIYMDLPSNFKFAWVKIRR